MKTDSLYEEDYRSLPWWRKLKWIWYMLTWRFVTMIGVIVGCPHWWNGGRHTDGDPTVCMECKRVYRVRDCVHGYQDDGTGESEPIDECPNCGMEI